MFPRYGRKNRRCKVKHPKDKITYAKKVLYQLATSMIMLAILIIMSLFDITPKAKIERYLYNTYSVNHWKRCLMSVTGCINNKTAAIGSVYMSWFMTDEKSESREISDPSQTVKAHKDTGNTKETENDENSDTGLQLNSSPVQRQWRMPVDGEISSGFGERIHPITNEKTIHNGMDIAADEGEAVFSVSDGVVERTGYDEANGKYVVVNHGEQITSVYIHLSEINVLDGAKVTCETQIGKTGSTGMATGPHLHFEIKENGVSVDPGKYITQ